MKKAKKVFAFFLTLCLVFTAVPCAFAKESEEQPEASAWEMYYFEHYNSADGFGGCFFFLPDPVFVRAAKKVKLDVTWTDETEETHNALIKGTLTEASTPEKRLAVLVDFFPKTHHIPFDYPISVRVPANSFYDAAGNGNEEITLTDYSSYQPDIDITCYGRLQQEEYTQFNEYKYATGDTLRLKANAWFPIDFFVDDEKILHCDPNDETVHEYLLKTEGDYVLGVKMFGYSLTGRWFDVIPSAQMYRQLLSDAAAELASAPSMFLVAPFGLLFLPVLRLFSPILGPAVAIGVTVDAVVKFFQVLSSFSRIYR